MKRRVTFIHEGEGEFDPQQAHLDSTSLTLRSLRGARQERLTFGFEELPNEFQQVLSQCVELHIRWVSEYPYSAITPFTSRLPPGLHIILSALTSNRSKHLCPLLQKTFDTSLNCTIPETSFIAPSSVTKSGALPSLQFYQLLPSLDQLATYIQEAICSNQSTECRDSAAIIRFADTLDIDYDRVLNSFVVTVYWSKSVANGGWKDTIHSNNSSKDKIDVGILAPQQPLDPDEIRIGGLLAVVGRDKEFKPTLFSFPSRHHSLPNSSTYKAQLASPTGLHPTLRLSISRSALSPPPSPPKTTCRLYTYITLPSYIFPDEYQLSTTDPLFLQSHNIRGLHHVAGETDLEAPDWTTRRWGSHLLVELATSNSDDASDWTSTIPLHLRYLHPSESGYHNVSLPWPVVFWACESEDQGKMDVNPFDRVKLSWDDFFGPKTFFYQFHPSPRPVTGDATREELKLVETIQVPVLQVDEDNQSITNQAKQIELGTVVVVVAGFLWILWRLGAVFKISGIRANRGQRTRETEKKTQ
ncbi:protease B nonderepressible form [Coccidioides posadasii str. Silveira]|uniref:Protein PBN1 n=1 Tax=Coccidioides posadasii (strain RMSCC 757 / Silveira) TaxID=443226 RepID=E9DAX4_COCPS|nr:hypothetical protein CPSG_06976 [Coccidioides posadasii str. Silveira]QVM11135.1 protease B nonderepressible form [Coccidioides posadasii str. Silveira]